jgi:glyoxylate/hydroxypyruvate reductase A
MKLKSTQPTILVYSPDRAKAYAECVRNHGFNHIKVAATSEEAKKHLPGTEIILGWKFPTHLLNKPSASSVSWYQSMGAGVDDLMADPTIPNNITITRIVDQFGTYISEYVFTFLLYMLKDVARMKQSQRESRWDPFIPELLAGKTIGVAGLGSIGAEIVQKARAFQMNVHGLSFNGKQAHLVDRHFSPEHWVAFVRDLDYLVLTLPLTDSTKHIINHDILLAMNPNTSIMNVGRGALINETDLVSVMRKGHLKAAILDVFETEPLPADHPLYTLPNVHITSHLSGPSTTDGVCSFFVNNIQRYVNDQPLQGLVNRQRGY